MTDDTERIENIRETIRARDAAGLVFGECVIQSIADDRAYLLERFDAARDEVAQADDVVASLAGRLAKKCEEMERLRTVMGKAADLLDQETTRTDGAKGYEAEMMLRQALSPAQSETTGQALTLTQRIERLEITVYAPDPPSQHETTNGVRQTEIELHDYRKSRPSEEDD